MSLNPPGFLLLFSGLLLSISACSASKASAGDAVASDPTAQASGHHEHGGPITEPKGEIAPLLDYALSPSAGAEIGLIYESYLSPQQEGDEEEDVPKLAPDVFKSTKPSTSREERPGRGHGIVAFNKEFSRAYVHLALEGIDPSEIVMAHIHCGLPGQLGPILVDFGKTGDISEYFADGRLDYEVTNRDLERVVEDSSGLVGAFTAGCPITPKVPNDRIRTIGGMAVVAGEGHLYFNVHTASQTFYGDVRGQLFPVNTWPEVAAEKP